MVSLWPWRGDDSSPASFEKTLSTLSKKITKATNHLDSVRQSSRRLKGLWTIYSIFAYLLCFIILVVGVGWRKWGPTEYTGVAVGPVVIYLGRLSLSTYYDYRISNGQAHVDNLQKQRDTVINKLKEATKYNSTQQLLEKYGGTPSSKPKATHRKVTPTENTPNKPNTNRTGFVPPPTANIPGRNPVPPSPSTPQRGTSNANPQGQTPPFSPASSPGHWQHQAISPTEEFAPNAFPSAPQYLPAGEGSRWYDRLMDVLLGEDETSPRNRIALVCSKCRLVNGQAPPGIKRLEDVGKWRCSSCGSMNGEESEARKIVAEINNHATTSENKSSRRGEEKNQQQKITPEVAEEDEEEAVLVSNEEGHETDITQYSSENESTEPTHDDDDDDDANESEHHDPETKEEQPQPQPQPQPPKPKRGRPKGSAKKQKS